MPIQEPFRWGGPSECDIKRILCQHSFTFQRAQSIDYNLSIPSSLQNVMFQTDELHQPSSERPPFVNTTILQMGAKTILIIFQSKYQIYSSRALIFMATSCGIITQNGASYTTHHPRISLLCCCCRCCSLSLSLSLSLSKTQQIINAVSSWRFLFLEKWQGWIRRPSPCLNPLGLVVWCGNRNV